MAHVARRRYGICLSAEYQAPQTKIILAERATWYHDRISGQLSALFGAVGVVHISLTPSRVGIDV
jgi:hypothetical protein